MSEPLLSVKNLKQYFRVSGNYTVKAVDDVSFDIYPGETYGLVGESGSGKSTIGRSVIRLYDPTAGEIRFDGMDLSGKMSKARHRELTVRMQMIFQDPMASLNPRKNIGDIIGEGLDIHKLYSEKGRAGTGASQPLSASVFGRTAAACRYRKSADHRTEAHYCG